jgi:hypothetical protein
MPLYYSIVPGAIQTTNVIAGTANDALFVKPGTRSLWMRAILPVGRGANLTNISGITYRVEKWFTTSSSGGTAVTASPQDPGYQAAKQTAGWAVGAVVSGTGGPTLMKSVGSGTTSPGNWFALPSLDDAPSLEGSANMSLDIFNVASAISLSYEMEVGTAE